MPNEYYIDVRNGAIVRILQKLSDKTVMVTRVRDNRRYIVALEHLKKDNTYHDRNN